MERFKSAITPDFVTLATASASLGSALLSGLFSFYYVKVFLQMYKINQTWLNAAQIFYIVCNAINEPLLGYVQDYGCKPCRNRRRVILFGGPLFAAAFLVPWFNWYDPATAQPYTVGLHLISVLFLWNFMFTLIGSALCGLFAEVSTYHEARVRLLRYNEIASLIASSAVFPVDKVSNSLQLYANFRYSCVAVAIVATICFLITGFKAPDEIAQTRRKVSSISEPDDNDDRHPIVYVEEEVAASAASIISPDPINAQVVVVGNSELAPVAEEHSFKIALKVVWQVFKTKDFWCAVGGNFTGWMRIQINANFTAIFTEGLVASSLLPSGSYAIATFYLLCQIMPRIVVILISPFAAKFGTYNVLMASYVLTWLNCGIGLICGTLFGYNFIIGTLIIESILTRFQVMFMVIFSDFIDEDTKRNKRALPASTLIFTLNGLLVKPTVALAPMIVVALLNIANYDEYKTDIRDGPPKLRFVMFLTCCCLPAIVAIIGFICMLPYGLKHKHLAKHNDQPTDN